MADDATPSAEQNRSALVLELYRGWLESMHRNEESGERRLEFFLTLLTAATAGLVALAASETLGQLTSLATVVQYSVFALLLLGLATFRRLVHRDRKTDLCGARLRAIVAHIAAGNVGMPTFPDKITPRPRPFFRGGLTTTMLIIDAMLCGVLVTVFSANGREHLNGSLGIVGGVVGGVLLLLWKRLDEQRSIQLDKT